MRLKSELYKKEQEEIVDRIIGILQLKQDNSITLYELDRDTVKQKKIMDLIPDIRKYFAFNNIKAVGEPSMIKRPWLSIIKAILKPYYVVINKQLSFHISAKKIRTVKYIFSKKMP